MNEAESQQKIERLFRESGLSISSKEGWDLFESLVNKYLVIDEIDSKLMKEAYDPQFSPGRIERLCKDIAEIRKQAHERTLPNDQDFRNRN